MMSLQASGERDEQGAHYAGCQWQSTHTLHQLLLLAPPESAHMRGPSALPGAAPAGADVLFVAILDTKEVAAAISEAGLNKAQLAAAVEEGRGSGKVDSATAGERRCRRLLRYGASLFLARCNPITPHRRAACLPVLLLLLPLLLPPSFPLDMVRGRFAHGPAACKLQIARHRQAAHVA